MKFPFDTTKVEVVNVGQKPLHGDPLLPFAFDEWQGRLMTDPGKIAVHFWRHEKAFILGLRDWKLPHAKEAVQWLETLGYQTAVRHSGGAAVPLDPGVLNVSVILPNEDYSFAYRDHFERFYEWIEACFMTMGVHISKGEVAGSYCPGDYDLSLQGLKFCGIAQRRQTKSTVIQAFINVEGSGEERANVVKQFYDRAHNSLDDDTNALDHASANKFTFPIVRPKSVCSLEEVSAIKTVDTLERLLLNSLELHNSQMTSRQSDYQDEDIRFARDQLYRRYRER